MDRYLIDNIKKDLKGKMVFLAGPRQVGKTTLAKKLVEVKFSYFRDIASREVDFVVTEKRKPIMCIECKDSDKSVSPSLNYFKNKFPEAEAFQVARSGDKDVVTKEKIRLIPAYRFLADLI